MGYVAKNRIGDKSGDLEIVSRSHRDSNRGWTWNAICHRLRDDKKCGNEAKIRTSQIGSKLCCRECSYKGRNNPGNSRYQWTPAQDAMITSIHRDRADKRTSTIPSYAQYAKRIGRPKHAVLQRKRALGLNVVPKEPDWSEAELHLLSRCSWMTVNMAYRRLRKAGFKRSLVAVGLQLKRRRLSRVNREWLNARDLAEGLGIDSHKVAEWKAKDLLNGKWRAFTDEEGNGTRGEYVFMPKHIRAFIFANSIEIDLRKVDHSFFFDIIQN